MPTTPAEQPHTISPLQQTILDIFKAVKVILDRHHLRYYAIGGTCIGAVRHQGFIPWDDDLDIGLPDTDYYRFLEYARAELPPRYRLVLSYESRHCASLGAKVTDTQTTFIESYELPFPEHYKGVFIDVFKLTGVPADPRERQKLHNRFVRLARFHEKRRLRLRDLPRMRTKLMYLAVLPLKVLPYRFWSDKIFRLTDSYPFDENPYMAFSWDANIGQVLLEREQVFGDGVALPFEDTVIRCPVDSDKMLTAIFGDYMQLPPVEERVGLHSTVSLIDLERPYTYYQQMAQQTGTVKKETT